MRGNVIAILCCVLTAICPAICQAEAAMHHAHAEHCGDDSRHERGHEPHHRHDSGGTPLESDSHACVCSSGATSPQSVQIPQLLPCLLAGAIHALRTPILITGLGPARIGESAAGDCPSPGGNLPLLI